MLDYQGALTALQGFFGQYVALMVTGDDDNIFITEGTLRAASYKLMPALGQLNELNAPLFYLVDDAGAVIGGFSLRESSFAEAEMRPDGKLYITTTAHTIALYCPNLP